MMSFRGTRLADTRLPLSTGGLLEALGECKGRQALFERQAPQLLKALRELALVESTESSNRIEGVTIERDRLRPLVLGKARPRDRSEEEIVGYRRALSWIHTSHEKIPIEPDTLKRQHALAQGGTSGDAGQWKRMPNDIVEVRPDGRREVRFRPVAPDRVISAVDELCVSYRQALAQGGFSPHHGHSVGRYLSLERIVEQTKESYYDALQRSSDGWHEGHHDVLPWLNYFLSTLRIAYREFEERAGRERPARGSKTDQVAYALENVPSPFGIADIERLCPNVSRDMIRVVMNRWREEGRLKVLGRGRDARWSRIARK